MHLFAWPLAATVAQLAFEHAGATWAKALGPTHGAGLGHGNLRLYYATQNLQLYSQQYLELKVTLFELALTCPVGGLLLQCLFVFCLCFLPCLAAEVRLCVYILHACLA